MYIRRWTHKDLPSLVGGWQMLASVDFSSEVCLSHNPSPIRTATQNLGGISFFSGRYGWACDSVLSFEIVLPNGAITTVDPNNHPDLFWALRGAGSSNFGVVTSFTLETIPLSNPAGVWLGYQLFSKDKAHQLLRLHN